MQYRHFNSSCAFCCVANLLELQGCSATDIQLFQAMNVEWMLHHSEESGTWETGAMLQGGAYFDLALRPMGFSLQETSGLSANEILVQEPIFMVGLKTGQGGRHAHILVERRDGRQVFLNPHSEGDGEPDLVILKEEECIRRLANNSTVGRLVPCQAEETDIQPLLEAAKENWHAYQAELTAFIALPHSHKEIRAARDPLFRALLLDGPEGARICGHAEQEARLRTLQGQFLSAWGEKEPLRLSEYMDVSTLEAAFAFYCAGPAGIKATDAPLGPAI